MSQPRLVLAALALLLVSTFALASGAAPPELAQRLDVGGREVAYWLGNESATEQALVVGEAGALWFAAEIATRPDANATSLTYYVNATADGVTFENASAVIEHTYGDAIANESHRFVTFPFAAPATAGPVTFTFTIEAYAATGENTTLLGRANGTLPTEARSIEVPQPPAGLPLEWLVAGGAVLVLAGGYGAYALKQRRERARMNAAPRRSQVMREMELERQLQRVEEKDPEAAAEIKQEIRAQEQVREKRRELQILEAKRADALKTLDLLKKRHEAGGLTKLQYDNMVGKKQADLQRIESEIAQMEAEDAAGSAAA